MKPLSPARKHSRLGIASTIMALTLPPLLTTLLFGAVSTNTKTSVGTGLSLTFIVVGLAGPLIHLVGLIMGIVGATFKDTNKLFPILGIVLNLFLGVLGVAIIFFLLKNLPVGFH